jgi:class 3 adenylate cyclase/tetratricopeptide (TPR) repeat protein
MPCSKCGTNNPSTNNFCAKCGNALVKHCAKCKAETPPTSDFCGKCGAPLTNGAVAAVATSPPPGLASNLHVAPESSSPEALDGERKNVTALFADIKGSMELIEDLDPEDARRLVDPALKLMMDAVHRYEGYVAQSTGDGIFALFGAPIAHEDHPQRALYAALRMQEDIRRHAERLRAEKGVNLQVRVGVNTGEVVVRSIKTDDAHTEYTPIGHSISLASRLQTLTAPGSIAISETVRKLVEGYFALKALGPTRIKGVSEPINVYELTGLGPLRTRLQRSAGRGLTKFVGRERETEALKHAAEQAKSGHGQIVAAMAEPGVGKSRLFFEFKATSQSGWMLLETFSVSHGKASAYLPVIDLLRNYFDISATDDERKRREKVAGRIAILDRSLEDALPYLFSLLGIVEGVDPLAQMNGQIRKRRTLEAIKRILLRESLNQPLMVIFEDLHWIDTETQALLNLLADSIATAKVLLLVNYRPEYRHEWGSRTYYTQLRLDPLSGDSAEDVLSAMLGDGIELAPLKHLIIDKTEGNPFFMEETVQALFDDAALVRNGTVKLTKSLSQLKIPPRVQAILASRMDRLPPDEKDLLQTLAVIGREFSFGLLRNVVAKSDEELNRMLTDLQLGEFVYEQPATDDIEFIFKHALTRDVAANSMLIEKRKALHERTAQAIEVLYAERLDDHVGNLAHHYAQSANTWQAVKYLYLAGQQAVQRSAHQQAIAHLTAGLELLDTLPESPEREARELELASALVQVLQHTKGYSAPETVEVAARARALAEKTGNLAQLVLQLSSICRAAFVSGNYRKAGVLADQLLGVAQRQGSPTSLWLAHYSQLQARCLSGDPIGAEENFGSMCSLFEMAGFQQVPGMNVAAMGNASLPVWILGRAERSRECILRANVFAQASKNPYDLAYARFWESWLYRRLREPQRADAAATQAVALSEEHGFLLLREMALICMGWARAYLGDTDEGVSLIRKGLAGRAENEARVGITDYITVLAEALALDGALTDALSTIEDALQANPQEMIFRPNILTCRGELQFKIGRAELAEADFREAIALAQKMSAKAWELGATTSLARLLAKQDRRDQARTMLADIYGWFTEGFDTAGLKDARALLDELAA